MTERRAVLATSDKTGVAELGRALHELGWSIFATAGTVAHLDDAGVPALETRALTGISELLGGRIKTLHPGIFGGLLYRRGVRSDEADMRRGGLRSIDLVACTYYPVEAALAGGLDIDDALERIDVGGPAMVRAAAKNHHDVLALVDPRDYPGVIARLTAGGGSPAAVAPDERRRLASKAFERTAAYDLTISRALAAPA